MILITGASRGIGNYLADNLAAKSNFVIGVGRSKKEHDNTEWWEYRECDVSSDEQVNGLYRYVTEYLHQYEDTLDGVINCAGVASMNSFLLTPVETLDKLYRVNVRGTYLVSWYMARIMMVQNFGRIINFSTCAVPMGLEGELAYVATKSAVEGMSRVMAKELAPYGITVNTIAPQPTKTDLIGGVDTHKTDAIVNRTIAKQYGDMNEIVNTVEWIMKSPSNQITGSTVYIGGV